MWWRDSAENYIQNNQIKVLKLNNKVTDSKTAVNWLKSKLGSGIFSVEIILKSKDGERERIWMRELSKLVENKAQIQNGCGINQDTYKGNCFQG